MNDNILKKEQESNWLPKEKQGDQHATASKYI